MLLSGKGAVITGASGNLGCAVVSVFLNQGARVVAVAHGESGLERIAAAAGEFGDRVRAVIADVTCEEGVASVKQAAEGFWGGPEVLANIAGGFQFGKTVWEMSPEDWDHMMALNLRSVFLCCRAFIPGMLESDYGRIVNVSTRGIYTLKPGMSAYTVSKAGVALLTQLLREELRGADVGVTAVCPGIIDTPQNRADMPKADPAKWVSPQELAERIAWLCSEDAGALSGSVVQVLGGG